MQTANIGGPRFKSGELPHKFWGSIFTLEKARFLSLEAIINVSQAIFVMLKV
jgi:hypothetical protein